MSSFYWQLAFWWRWTVYRVAWVRGGVQVQGAGGAGWKRIPYTRLVWTKQ